MKKNNEHIMNLISILTSFFTKSGIILSNCWGWLFGVFIAISAYFMGIHSLIYIIFALIIVDFFLGLITTYKYKGKHSIESRKIGKTAIKLATYVGALMILYAAEFELGFYDGFILSKIVFALIVLTELWSSASMLLLLNHNIPFLRVFQTFIIKELSNKLGKSEEEVKEILNENRKKINTN